MEIEEIIKKIDTLQPVSSVGHKIMEIINNPGSSMRDIVDVVKYDQSITANILKICNSSYFGFRQKISSVQQAVSLLGTEKVANLIVMGNSSRNFVTAQSNYDLEAGELWRYSVASALIAEDIAQKKNLENSSHIFTSALLKDIGKVVLNSCVTDDFDTINRLVTKTDSTFVEAEREVIGIDHAELGARIAEKWDFSPSMVEIIRYHHEPHKSPGEALPVMAVYMADSICMMIGVGVGADGLSYRHHQDAVDRLGISDVDIQIIIAEFWEKLKSVEELVNISGGYS